MKSSILRRIVLLELMGCTVISLGAVPWLGCSTQKRTIKIPASVVAKPEQGQPPRVVQPYVIKMSDGQRTWQVEIPVGDGAPAFQAAIPLDLGDVTQSPPDTPETEADREIIEAKRKKGEPITKTAGEKTPSYLSTLARVKELYKRRQYELALMDIVALDRVYPDDEKILEMKGTLYSKLNRIDEARQAWERVLVLNPDNLNVARALEQLLENDE